MGWMWTHKPQDISIKEFFEEELFSSGKSEIVEFSVVKFKTAYMAVKVKETGEIWGLVCLLGYAPKDYFNFGYKDIDEAMGPCECDCPEKILKLLTPTDHEWAKKWREKCWEKINNKKNKPKVKDGDMIKFSIPIKFTNGDKLDTFKVDKRGKKIIFWDGWRAYKIRNWQELEYNIV